ncbi:hypothetical protein [uncultured Chitinophaga sp.]|uniref:hypothetical protein n=1 Tax=uncultured Chitinophaga sp. TaxID=339340 RepID=UPI0025FF2C8F|nr:hypothetical protein [uncultured Chitinophaga sp.]
MRLISSNKGFFLSVCMVAAFTLAACNNNAKPPNDDSLQNYGDTTRAFDTSHIRYDTSVSTDTSPVNKPGRGGEDTVRFSQHN